MAKIVSRGLFGDNLFDWFLKCESHSDLHKTLPTCLFSSLVTGDIITTNAPLHVWWLWPSSRGEPFTHHSYHSNHCSLPMVATFTYQHSTITIIFLWIPMTMLHINSLIPIFIPCPCYCPPLHSCWWPVASWPGQPIIRGGAAPVSPGGCSSWESPQQYIHNL